MRKQRPLFASHVLKLLFQLSYLLFSQALVSSLPMPEAPLAQPSRLLPAFYGWATSRNTPVKVLATSVTKANKGTSRFLPLSETDLYDFAFLPETFHHPASLQLLPGRSQSARLAARTAVGIALAEKLCSVTSIAMVLSRSIGNLSPKRFLKC